MRRMLVKSDWLQKLGPLRWRSEHGFKTEITLDKVKIFTRASRIPHAQGITNGNPIRLPRSSLGDSLVKSLKAPSDINYDLIQSHMTCEKFNDSIWGLVLYRCSSGRQKAWEHLVRTLREGLLEGLRHDERKDLLNFHDLHIIDDEALYGADSHRIRDHFQSWVPKNLNNRLKAGVNEVEADVGWLHASSTPRYEYCLFVDDLCLRSVDHPGVNSPVLKLLCRDWETPFPLPEGNKAVPAPFHDGYTEFDEEDVGWMYMLPHAYLYKYHLLGKGDWDEQYIRPPFIDESYTMVEVPNG